MGLDCSCIIRMNNYGVTIESQRAIHDKMMRLIHDPDAAAWEKWWNWSASGITASTVANIWKKWKVKGKKKEHDAVRKYVQNYQLSINGETIGRQKKCNEGLSEAIAAR